MSFTDDWGNQETRTSDVTVAVAAAPSPSPLTAAIHDKPESHNGQDAFKFELRFSEDPKGRLQLQDAAGPCVHGDGRHCGRGPAADGDSDTPNIRWEISVSPDSNADVTVELPATEDCGRAGGHLHRGRQGAVQPAEIHRQGASADSKFRKRPDVPQRQRRTSDLRIAFSEAPQDRASATPRCATTPSRWTGGSVDRRAAAGQRQEPPAGRSVVSPDSNGDVTITAARHHGLRRAGGHLRRRRQEVVQPPGAHRQRAGAVMDNEKKQAQMDGRGRRLRPGTWIPRGVSHTGMGALPSNRRGPAAMLWERLAPCLDSAHITAEEPKPRPR